MTERLCVVEEPDEHGSMYVHYQTTRAERGVVKKTIKLDDHVILDFDEAGVLCGIEILGVITRIIGERE